MDFNAEAAPEKIAQASLDFSNAPFYRKRATLSLDKVRISEGAEKIDTIVDGKLERSGTTSAGDRVVTGGKGEEYIIKAEKWPTLWEKDPDNTTQFRSLNRGNAIQTDKSLTVVRNDGTEVHAKSGDYLFFSHVTNTVNVIDQVEFIKTYGRPTNNTAAVEITTEHGLDHPK